MRDAQTISVRAFIDEHPVSRHQMLIAGRIFLVVAFDGMDIGIMGYAAPEIIRTWGISKPEMGGVLSAVFFGMALRGTATEVPEKTKGRGTSNPPVLPRSSTVRPMTQPILGVGSRERIVGFAPAARVAPWRTTGHDL
jgi:hypothetical protein